MKIKNIVFDFGGVLLDWNPKYLYEKFFSDKNEAEYFLTKVYYPEWNLEQDRGRPFAEGIKILQSQHPKYGEAIQAFFDRWEEMVKGEIPEGVNLLHKFKSEGYKIYGLTNWSTETICKAYARYDFFKVFDGIVVSGEEKLVKPDKRIYEVLLERYKLSAQESVFIDDNIENVKAAQELGFKAVHFKDIPKALKCLYEILSS